MQTLQADPDIHEALFSFEENLKIQRMRFLAAGLRDLLVRYDTASCDEQLWQIEWSETSACIDATYSCGFVYHEASQDMGDRDQTPVSEFIRRLTRDLGRVNSLSLPDLRRIRQYSMRSERWGAGNAGTGGGAVWGPITSRLGNAIARGLGA